MQVTHQLFKDNYFKSFIILKKLQRALAKNIYLKLAPNGWVYEQGCLAECFKLSIPLVANLLIYRVSSRFLFTN